MDQREVDLIVRCAQRHYTMCLTRFQSQPSLPSPASACALAGRRHRLAFAPPSLPQQGSPCSPAPPDALVGGRQRLTDTSAPPSLPQQRAPEPALPPHLLPLAPLLGVSGLTMPPGRPLPGCDDGTAVGPPPFMTAEAAELAKGEVATPDGDHLPSSTL